MNDCLCNLLSIPSKDFPELIVYVVCNDCLDTSNGE